MAQKQEMAVIHYDIIDTPIGPLLLAAGPAGLTEIRFCASDGTAASPDPTWQHAPNVLHEAADQLRAYFAGERQAFDLALAPQGTDFQQEVWAALQTIPYGETISYGELAARVGRPPGAARAVGAANGQNPLPVVVPCHRVIGSDGELTGYAGGLHIKRALLELERRVSGRAGTQLSLF